jgi:hypothetical protein
MNHLLAYITTTLVSQWDVQRQASIDIPTTRSCRARWERFEVLADLMLERAGK